VRLRERLCVVFKCMCVSGFVCMYLSVCGCAQFFVYAFVCMWLYGALCVCI